MAILDLIIDLPKHAYTIVDKPNTAQQFINGLTATLATILYILATIGEGIIYAVIGLGQGVKWLLDRADSLRVKLESLPRIIGNAFIGLFINQTVNYVA